MADRDLREADISRNGREALLVIAGEKPIEASGVKPVAEQPEALDRDWAERPAFADAAIPGVGSTM